MSTLKELKAQVENANAVGIANLIEKGVEIPEGATTYDIMQKIADVAGSGTDDVDGVSYSDITFNADDTITLTEQDGVVHTMSCTYEDDKLVSVSYDNDTIPLVYNESELVKIGGTDIEIVTSQTERLYQHYGIEKNEYPYVAIMKKASGYLYGYFFQTYTANAIGSTSTSYSLKYMGEFNTKNAVEDFPSETDFKGVVDYTIKYLPEIVNTVSGSGASVAIFSNSVFWSNIVQWQPYGSALYTFDKGIEEIQNGFALGMASGGVVEVEDSEVVAKGKTNLAEHGIVLGDTATSSDVVDNILKIPATQYFTYLRMTDAEFPENTELVLNLPKMGGILLMFQNAKNLVKVKISGNENNLSDSFLNAFNNCTDIKEIDFSGFNCKPTSLQYTFSICRSLVKILGEFDMTNITSTLGAFSYCVALEELRIKPNTLSISLNLAQSSKLSAETVQSIVDGLATVETAQTLTLNSAIVLTDEQKATIESKGWLLVQ